MFKKLEFQGICVQALKGFSLFKGFMEKQVAQANKTSKCKIEVDEVS